MDLQNNQLSGSIPVAIRDMSSLEILELDDNLLTGSIPADLGNLTNLIDLNIEDNLFTGSIPLEIGSLINLEYLDLQNLQLTGAVPPEFINLVNLVELDLRSNQLVDIPDLSAIATFEIFNIESNNFHFDDIEPNVNITGADYEPQNQITGPGDQEIDDGSTLNISIAVGGSQNQYQWVKNGVDLSGETTSNLVVSNFQPTDAGIYYLNITNSLV